MQFVRYLVMHWVSKITNALKAETDLQQSESIMLAIGRRDFNAMVRMPVK